MLDGAARDQGAVDPSLRRANKAVAAWRRRVDQNCRRSAPKRPARPGAVCDMLNFMNKINLITSSDEAVRRLAHEHPEWMPVLEAAVAVAERTEAHGGEFAGAWVLDEVRARGGPSWFPNLRILASHGLVEKSGASTRGGRRAYYRMPDRAGVARAIEAWRRNGATQARRRLSFIGTGASTEPPADMARQAGEISYEPRSWR